MTSDSGHRRVLNHRTRSGSVLTLALSCALLCSCGNAPAPQGPEQQSSNQQSPAGNAKSATDASGLPVQQIDSLHKEGEKAQQEKNYDQAQSHYLDALKLIVPKNDAFLQRELDSICQVAQLQNGSPEARKAIDDALAITEKTAPDSAFVLQLLEKKSSLAASARDYKTGRDAAKKAMALAEKNFGDSSIELIKPLTLYIGAACADGSCGDLEPEWRRVLAIKVKQFGWARFETQMTAFQLAEVLEKKKKYKDCKEVLKTLLVERQKENSLYVPATLAALGRIESKQGHKKEAVAYLQQAITVEKSFKQAHISALPFLNKLLAQIQQGKVQ